jgi:polyisoprenoid-binding protein YceI
MSLSPFRVMRTYLALAAAPRGVEANSTVQGRVSVRRGLSWYGPVALSTMMLLCPAGMHAATAAEGWHIDESHSSIGFKIDAVGSPTTHGRFNHYSSRIVIDLQHPERGFMTFVIDSASIDVGSELINDFAKSWVLLDVEKFPTLSFTSTHVETVDAHTARVTGNLTMLGITKPIILTVNIEADSATQGGAVLLVVTATIRRSEFGMTFGLPLINDALEIAVQARALPGE